MNAAPPSPALPAGAKRRAAEARCEAMIRHARAQITAAGIDRFSLNEVLRLAGGSKATLVKYFGDRNGLIAAAIGAEARETMGALSLRTPTGASLEAALCHMLEGVLAFYLEPGALALYRAVIGAGGDIAGLGEAFYEAGHGAVIEAVAALLMARVGTEVSPRCDCRDVAAMLVQAIRAGIHEQALLGLATTTPDAAAIADRVRRVVRLVLPGLRDPA